MLTSEQMKVYKLLEENKILSSSKIAKLLGYKDTALVRRHVATLREAYFDYKIEMLVCFKENQGYFLSDDPNDAIPLITRNHKQAMTMLYNNSILKKRMNIKDNIRLDV